MEKLAVQPDPRVQDPLAADPTLAPFARDVPFVRVVAGFLDGAGAAALRDRVGALGPAPAPITTARGAVMRPELRNNERVIFDDEALAASLFARARALLPPLLRGEGGPRSTRHEGARWALCGLNERFRGYRYGPGQRFGPHYDGCFARSRDEVSALTFLVYLDEGCVGGETRLLDWGVTVSPRAGTLLVFDHYVNHEGAMVVEGVKTVLRSDVMYRRVRAEG